MPAPRIHASPILLVPVLLSLFASGCETLECEDGGRLEAAYVQGQEAALAQNDADYRRGRTEGLALSFEDGEVEGYRAGFDDGYGAGYWESGDYQAGYSLGFELGYDEGYASPAACESGDEAGYEEGFALGDSDGYALGYGLGYDDWYRPCGAQTDLSVPRHAAEDDEPSAKEIGQCHSRGMRSARDLNAFEQGRRAGIAENADYLEGYERQYALGFAEGDTEGRLVAYDEGLSIGFSDGADAGWDDAWVACYDTAYPEGYESGYAVGYDAGYSDGSYQGDADAGC